MKIVLDTNVFISGIFFSGPPAEILKAWRSAKFQILFSPQILEEYRLVAESLAEKYPKIDIIPIIDLFMVHGELIDVEENDEPVCEDPDDDKFIECAITGNCQIIVSGDKHLLQVSGHKGITVLNPREFLDRCLKKIDSL